MKKGEGHVEQRDLISDVTAAQFFFFFFIAVHFCTLVHMHVGYVGCKHCIDLYCTCLETLGGCWLTMADSSDSEEFVSADEGLEDFQTTAAR